MCWPASFVVTRDRVFWSKRSDSHEDIIREFRLYADGVRGANIVRVEIVPPSGDLRVSTDRWELSVDQNDVPDWFDRKRCEEQVRLALVDWVSAKIVTEGSRNIADGECYAYGSSRVTASGSSTVTAYDSSSVTACDSSTVTACEHCATVRHYSTTDPVLPVGPHAVVIDSRGKKSVVVVGE